MWSIIHIKMINSHFKVFIEVDISRVEHITWDKWTHRSASVWFSCQIDLWCHGCFLLDSHTRPNHQSIAYFFSHFQSFGFGGPLPKCCQAGLHVGSFSPQGFMRNEWADSSCRNDPWVVLMRRIYILPANASVLFNPFREGRGDISTVASKQHWKEK